MKPKINNNNPVTKRDLVDALKEYPTKKDLTNVLKDYPTKKDLSNALKDYPTKQDMKLEMAEALKDYPTKQDLSERLTVSQNAFRVELDHKFEAMSEDIRTDFSKFTNLVLTAIDPLLKELEVRQQDREIANAQMIEVKEKIQDHELRIKKLEHS